MSWEIILAGFLVGILIGLTGMGGGSILTPALILLFNIDPVTALGTGFVVSALTRAVGAWNHWRLGNVQCTTVVRLLRGCLPGVLLGFGILKLIERYALVPLNDFLRHAIGVALILVALTMLFPSFWNRLQERARQLSERRRERWIGLSTLLVGILIGITSVGTGSLLVPFLIAFFPASLPQVVGVNVFHGSIITVVSALLHSVSGSVDWKIGWQMLAGMVPGILAGSQLSVLVPKRTLELILASTLLTTSIKLI